MAELFHDFCCCFKIDETDGLICDKQIGVLTCKDP